MVPDVKPHACDLTVDEDNRTIQIIKYFVFGKNDVFAFIKLPILESSLKCHGNSLVRLAAISNLSIRSQSAKGATGT